MTLRDKFEKLADDRESHSAIDKSLQALSSVVAPIYGTAAVTNRILRQLKILERKTLGITTISVGNITVGGTGKTPFTIWMAKFAKSEGFNPVILSRGYQRQDEDAITIVHNGKKLKSNVDNGGDEPILMAKKLGNVPIVACSNRYRGGKYAEKRLQVDCAILDDGMQHHKLTRQGEIVLLDSTKPLDRLQLLPRGTLREPLNALGRANLLVVTRCEQAKNLKVFLKRLRTRCPNTPIVRTKFSLIGFERLADGKEIDHSKYKGKKVYLVCAVGNPESVAGVLKKYGIEVVGKRVYKDHATFSNRDINQWRRAAKNAGASRIIVTEKDGVKLSDFERLPKNLMAMKIDMEFLTKRDQSIAENTVRSRLRIKPVRGFLN